MATATKQELANARELLDLDVREVSLVDHPANLREFLVVKRLEDPMGVFETDYSHGGVDPSQIGLVVTKSDDDGDATTEVEKAISADQKKAVGAVMTWMGKMAKGPGAPADAIKTVSSLLTKIAKETGEAQPAQIPTTKSTGGEVVSDVTKTSGEVADVMKARHAYELATAKAKGDDATESVEDVTKRHTGELEKAGFPFNKPGEKKPGKKAETTKAVDGVEGGAPAEVDVVKDAIVIKADGSVHVSGDAVNVNKAKGFTAPRVEALKGAVASLMKLLGDVDAKQLKEAFAQMSDGRFPDLPSNASVPSAVRPVPTTKAADGAEGEGVTEQIAAIVTKAMEPVTKRLDEIEKTRNPSQSVEGDGGSDGNKTEVNKSLWDGVL